MVISGFGNGAKSAGNVFSRSGNTVTATSGVVYGFTSIFKDNSYIRDAVVEGGTRMGTSGTIGFVGRTFGGIKNIKYFWIYWWRNCQ